MLLLINLLFIVYKQIKFKTGRNMKVLIKG